MFVRLALPDTKINAAISMATERHLEQAHHLLAATYPNGRGPSDHFGTSAAVMTLLAIAAASSTSIPRSTRSAEATALRSRIAC